MEDSQNDLKTKKFDIVYLSFLSILLIFLISVAVYLQVRYIKNHSTNKRDINGKEQDDGEQLRIADKVTKLGIEIKMFEFEREKVVVTPAGTQKMINTQHSILLPLNHDSCRIIGIENIDNQRFVSAFGTNVPSADIFPVDDESFVYLNEDDQLIVLSHNGAERLRLNGFHYLNSFNYQWFAFDYDKAVVLTEKTVDSPQRIAPVYEVVGRAFYNFKDTVLRVVRRKREEPPVVLLEDGSGENELPIQNVSCICMDGSFAIAGSKNGDVLVTDLVNHTHVQSFCGVVKFIAPCQGISDGIFLMVTIDNRCLVVDVRENVKIIMDTAWPQELFDVDDRMSVRFHSDTNEFVVVANTPHSLLYAATGVDQHFTVHVILNGDAVHYFHSFNNNLIKAYAQKKDMTIQLQKFQRKSIYFSK